MWSSCGDREKIAAQDVLLSSAGLGLTYSLETWMICFRGLELVKVALEAREAGGLNLA
jgi:hypothetical protein